MTHSRRVGIVNDIAMIAEGLRRAVTQNGQIDIAWIAYNGAEAVKLAEQDPPDLILMDLLMPVMNGVEATRLIMESHPCPILIVTASVDENISEVFQAMSFGALDAVRTPLVQSDGPKDTGELLRKIETTLLAANSSISQLVEQRVRDHQQQQKASANCLIAIGASSGGPRAILRILEQMPRDLDAGIVVVQHVDEHFAPRFVDWLASRVDLPVVRAEQGKTVLPGTVYVAVSSDHLILDTCCRFLYTHEPKNYPYRPSVDVFFASVAEYWKNAVMGVLLTGMGADGALGLKRMNEHGFYTIAQDQASSAVYGMPKVARDLGAATDILPLEKIGTAVVEFVKKSGNSR